MHDLSMPANIVYMEDVTYRKIESDGKRTAYEVLDAAGKVLGVVRSRREGTYRKHGRIRYPSGNRTMWGYDRPGSRSRGVFLDYTRKQATRGLLAALERQ